MDKKVFDYVKKYFKSRFPEKCIMMENDEISNIVIEVCKELKIYERNQILDSKVDEVVFDLLNGFVKKNRNKLWNDTINLENYVSEYVNNTALSDCSEEITNYIVKQIVVKLIPHYNLSKMKKGLFDNNIQLLYKEQVNELYAKIYNEVYKRVTLYDVAFAPGFKNDRVSTKISRYLIQNGSFDVLEKLRANAYEKYIKTGVLKEIELVKTIIESEKAKEKEEQKSRMTPVEYIFNLIVERIDVEHYLTSTEAMNCAAYINERLSVPSKNRDRGLTADEIISHTYDTEIVRYYNRYLMKKNSTVSKEKPKKVKRQPKLRWMQKNLSVLLITATLLGVAGTGVYGLGRVIDGAAESVVGFVDDVTNIKYNRALDEFDSYEYSYIFSKDNNDVKPTAKNAITFYKKVEDKGYNNDNYNYLGFYRAYKNVREHRLQIMDRMLGIVQAELSGKNDNNELYGSVVSSSCYLEFAMDRLEDMGFEQVNEDKYQQALHAYLDAKNTHFGQDPMNFVNEKHQKVIYEIMEQYQKYSDQLMVELGVVVHQENEKPSNLTDLSGRGM